MSVQLDASDRKILAALQEDATRTIADLAHDYGMSHNTCWRRIKRLEDNGLIMRRVALLDGAMLGFEMTIFVSIKASEHSDEWFRQLREAVIDIPEVVEFYRMAGDVDYLLKLKVENIAAYDRVYRRLIRSVRLSDVSSAFSMEEIKCTTALPLR